MKLPRIPTEALGAIMIRWHTAECWDRAWCCPLSELWHPLPSSMYAGTEQGTDRTGVTVSESVLTNHRPVRGPGWGRICHQQPPRKGGSYDLRQCIVCEAIQQLCALSALIHLSNGQLTKRPRHHLIEAGRSTPNRSRRKSSAGMSASRGCAGISATCPRDSDIQQSCGSRDT